MFPFSKYLLQLIYSVFFSISVLLPASITVFSPQYHIGDAVSRNNKLVRIGIGSIKAILGSLAASDPDDVNSDGSSEGSQVLVLQHQVVVQTAAGTRPPFTVTFMPADASRPAPPSPRVCDHPGIPRYQETDGFIALKTGLSPPALVLRSLSLQLS